MNVETIISSWLDGVQKDLTINYKRLGLKASGGWPKQLEQFQEVSAGRIRAGMLGANYTQWIENGRGPNRDQSKEGLKAWVGWAGSTFLKQWVKDKKINISPFAVAWKIALRGWKVPNQHNAGGLVSDVITKDRIQELNRALIFSVIEDFRSEVIKEFK
jgi:hypothetical protein